MKILWRKIRNLVAHGRWTACEHKRVEINRWYIWECEDCGAVFLDPPKR